MSNQSQAKFKTIEDAWYTSKRNAFSDLMPAKIERGMRGAFYMGAQSMFVLLAEHLKINPTLAPKEVLDLFNECQAYFATEKARTLSEKERS